MNRYTLLILLSALLASCANTKAESEDYVISADRNDIKEKDPELWSWIETQSKSIRSKEKQAKPQGREASSDPATHETEGSVVTCRVML